VQLLEHGDSRLAVLAIDGTNLHATVDSDGVESRRRNRALQGERWRESPVRRDEHRGDERILMTGALVAPQAHESRLDAAARPP
jgi:hypothetical protein